MRISVITVNYNNAAGLERTIRSVIAQKHENVEYIIIDGGSTDNSVEIINKFPSGITKWVSEKDRGVYHAMNKGIKLSTHDYLLFLNSGDEFYAENSLQILAGASTGEDLIYGDLMLNENGKEKLSRYPSVITFSYFLNSSLPHPGTLINRKLFDKVGLYNEELKIVSDWEFFAKAICKYDASYKHVDQPVSIFYVGGISSLTENRKLVYEEVDTVMKKEFPRFIPDYERHKEVERDLHLLTRSFLFKALRRSKVLRYLHPGKNKIDHKTGQ